MYITDGDKNEFDRKNLSANETIINKKKKNDKLKLIKNLYLKKKQELKQFHVN